MPCWKGKVGGNGPAPLCGCGGGCGCGGDCCWRSKHSPLPAPLPLPLEDTAPAPPELRLLLISRSSFEAWAARPWALPWCCSMPMKGLDLGLEKEASPPMVLAEEMVSSFVISAALAP